jgi:hypothetical protein
MADEDLENVYCLVPNSTGQQTNLVETVTSSAPGATSTRA